MVNFDPNSISDEYITAALNWAKAWDGHEYNDYRDNLKVIASMDACEWKHLGYLASLFMATACSCVGWNGKSSIIS